MIWRIPSLSWLRNRFFAFLFLLHEALILFFLSGFILVFHSIIIILIRQRIEKILAFLYLFFFLYQFFMSWIFLLTFNDGSYLRFYLFVFRFMLLLFCFLILSRFQIFLSQHFQSLLSFIISASLLFLLGYCWYGIYYWVLLFVSGIFIFV